MRNELALTSDNDEDDFISAKKLGVDDKYVPEGWESAEKFLEHIVRLYDADVGYDQSNRDWAMEDLKFAAGDQWDPDVKKMREKAYRPCLTINVLPQYIGQVIGDRRMNKTAIKVRPFRDGSAEVADIRSGLIRSIETFSRAERVYDATCEDQVTCGIGNFRVDLEYAGNDVFDQDITLRHIPNPLAVVWDRMSVDPTGRDARHCFVADTIPKEVYEKQYPDEPCPAGFTTEAKFAAGWFDSQTVRITEFWEIIQKPATFMLAKDGDVKDITGMEEADYIEDAWVDPRTGAARIRKSSRSYARMHLVSGFAILSEAYELPLTRLPIIRAEGRVIRVGEDRVRFGLVRFAKDSQRLKNYWRSVAAETLALAPKAQWLASSDAVEGREKAFREAHLTGDPLLIHNKNTEKPDRIDPPAVPAALLQEAQLNQQDIKDTTGLHDASLGMRSNEVSGKAINARQREGDVATVIYHDNLNHAILEAGDVINQLIPVAYDTTRTLRVIGEDEKHKLMKVNDPNDENSPDITMGKYDVVLDTGPSFTTQRLEAYDAMMTLLQTNPDLMQVIGDKVAEKMDWPGATEIAARLKKMVPKELLSDDELAEQQGAPQQPSPQEQMADQLQQAQLSDAAAQLQHAEQLRQLEIQQEQEALRKAQSDATIAEANARRAEAQAEEAEHRAAQAEIEATVSPFVKQQEMDHAEDTHNQDMQHKDADHELNSRMGELTAEQKLVHGEQNHRHKARMNEQQAKDRSQQSKQPRPGANKQGAPRKGTPNAK